MKEIKSKDELEQFVKDNDNVCVDFWAPWCGPCKYLLPRLEELENENEGIAFCKVNVDEVVDLPKEFGISSIPTLLHFRNGENIASKMGAAYSTSQLKEWLNS